MIVVIILTCNDLSPFKMFVYCWQRPHCTMNSLQSCGTATTLEHGRSESHLGHAQKLLHNLPLDTKEEEVAHG
jgi:hypothetical protein